MFIEMLISSFYIGHSLPSSALFLVQSISLFSDSSCHYFSESVNWNSLVYVAEDYSQYHQLGMNTFPSSLSSWIFKSSNSRDILVFAPV